MCWLLMGVSLAQAQFTYTTNADGVSATITGYTGPGGTVNIPSQIDGLAINDIGNSAFSDNSELTNLTVAEGITNIGEFAFSECANLAHLLLPDSLTTISLGAFAVCPSLTNFTIPEGVTSIGASAFAGCACTAIVLPDTVTSIGSEAFAGCRAVTVVIPAGVTNVGATPFLIDPLLSEVIVDPNNLFYESRGGVLYGKRPYALIEYPPNLLGPCTIPGGVNSIDDNAFHGCTGLTGVTIPEGVTNLGDSAFMDCTALTKVALPGGLTVIPQFAFFDCTNLTSVTIPSGVGCIGEVAFSGCLSLASITIPSSVTNLGDYTFTGCSSLSSVYFEGNAPSITASSPWGPGQPFGSFGPGSDGNVIVYYPPNATGWYSSFYGVPALPLPQDIFDLATNSDGTLSITAYTWTNGSIVIPSSVYGLPVSSLAPGCFANNTNIDFVTISNGVTSIGALAFYGCTNLASIVLPASVTNIGSFAFYSCSALASVAIPGAVAAIANAAFDGCTNLSTIAFGEGVAMIGDLAFEGCSSLTSVTIPDSVTNIGDQAFGNCANLAAVNFQGNAPALGPAVFYSDNATVYYVIGAAGWSSSLGGLPAVEEVPFIYTTNADGTLAITSFTGNEVNLIIPSSIGGRVVADIASIWGEGMLSVVRVEIPGTVRNIGEYAFAFTPNLAYLVIPPSVTNIENEAFLDCQALTNSIISDGVGELGTDAFSETSLFSVTIPASLTNIGPAAFGGCVWLTNFTVDPENPAYSSLDGVLFDKGQKTLIQYPCAKTGQYTIPSTVSAIADSAFANCAYLTSVTLPDWTVVRSCSLFQPKNIGVATAGQADFGCEKFLEGNAFG